MLSPFGTSATVTPLRVPGLPVAASTPRSPSIGATTTNLTAPEDVADVSGQPSMKIHGFTDGIAMTTVERKTKYASLLDERDLKELQRYADRVVERMIAQSQGPLTTKQQRRMGHPYGRNERGHMRGKLGNIGHVKGRRGGAPNLTIVNRQSGKFARSWSALARLTPFGAAVDWKNSAEYARFLALGTRPMQAHGPWTDAPTATRSELNSAFQKMISQAIRRKSIEAMMARSLGM